MIVCKSASELARMRTANALVADVLGALKAMVLTGVTTLDLDAVAESLVRDGGAEPAFKGYRGYPATLCTSVNEEVVHGIPSKRPLKAGDIVSLDVGVLLDGFYGDSALTVPVGEISVTAAKLLSVTEQSLERAISAVRAGARVSDLGHAVQHYVEANG